MQTYPGWQTTVRQRSDEHDLGAKLGVEGRRTIPRDIRAQNIPGGLETAQEEHDSQQRSLDQPIMGDDRLHEASLDQPSQGGGDRPKPSLDQPSKEDGDRLNDDGRNPGDESKGLDYKYNLHHRSSTTFNPSEGCSIEVAS